MPRCRLRAKSGHRFTYSMIRRLEANSMCDQGALTDAAVADGVPTRSLRLPAHEFGSQVDPLQWRLCSEFPQTTSGRLTARKLSPNQPALRSLIW